MRGNRPTYPHVHQINVSDGGVPKRPVFEARVFTSGMEGDQHENLKFHGGPDRAVSLFSIELIERLQDEGHPIESGSCGENLTLAGLEWNLIRPGLRLMVGSDLLIEVTAYASPCHKNKRWFRDGDWSRISQKSNPGWSRVYARVLRKGIVRLGDLVVIDGPGSANRGSQGDGSRKVVDHSLTRPCR